MTFGGVVWSKEVWFLGLLALASALSAPDCINQDGNVLEAKVPSDGDREKWAKDGVKAHNKLRRKHGAPDLVYNSQMCKSAQWTANKNAAGGKMTHTKKIDGIGDGMKCGENLAWYWSSSPELKPASETVQSWYDEIKDYDFNTHEGAGTGHFTQVVWKGSKEMCMSYKQAEDGGFYVAAQYYPPGNYIGEHGQNVFALGSASVPGDDSTDLEERSAGSGSGTGPPPTAKKNNACHIQISKILIFIFCFLFVGKIKSNFA